MKASPKRKQVLPLGSPQYGQLASAGDSDSNAIGSNIRGHSRVIPSAASHLSPLAGVRNPQSAKPSDQVKGLGAADEASYYDEEFESFEEEYEEEIEVQMAQNLSDLNQEIKKQEQKEQKERLKQDHESPSHKDASSSEIQFTDFHEIQKTFRTGATGLGVERPKIEGLAAKSKRTKKKNQMKLEDVEGSMDNARRGEEAAKAVGTGQQAENAGAQTKGGAAKQTNKVEGKQKQAEMSKPAPVAAGQDKLSEEEGADKAPSYYEEESEYDEEEEYESEEEEREQPLQPAKVGGWTDAGSGEEGHPKIKQGKLKTKQPQKKKDFDPRTDKMLDINSSEDFLMESLKNFRPPQEKSLDQSRISALEKIVLTQRKPSIKPSDAQVVAGVQMKNMMDTEEDLHDIMQLENPNYLAEQMEQDFRRTHQSGAADQLSELLENSQKETIRHQNSFQTKTDLSEAPAQLNPIMQTNHAKPIRVPSGEAARKASTPSQNQKGSKDSKRRTTDSVNDRMESQGNQGNANADVGEFRISGKTQKAQRKAHQQSFESEQEAEKKDEVGEIENYDKYQRQFQGSNIDSEFMRDSESAAFMQTKEKSASDEKIKFGSGKGSRQSQTSSQPTPGLNTGPVGATATRQPASKGMTPTPSRANQMMYQQSPTMRPESADHREPTGNQLIEFDKYNEAMKQVVERQQVDKNEMDKYGDQEAGIKYVKAQDFEVINNRKRYVHPQPFTDKEIKDAFFTFDMSGNGFIAAGEIRFVLDALGENVTDEEIDEMIRMIDMDGDGQVNYKEFFKMASGDGLAPLGAALPAPKDIKEVKKLNAMNATMMKSQKGNSFTGPKSKMSSSHYKTKGQTPGGASLKDDVMNLNASQVKTPTAGGILGALTTPGTETPQARAQRKAKQIEEPPMEADQDEYASEYDAEEFGEDEQEEEPDVLGAKRQQQAAAAGITLSGAKATPHLVLDAQKKEAQKRKAGLVMFCSSHNYIDMESVRQLLDVYYEQDVPEYLDYQAFIKFVRTDDGTAAQKLFNEVMGSKLKKLDSKVVILYLLNCVQGCSKEEKLRFAFNLFDEEDSRLITVKELKRILQANYFAASTSEVEKKAKLILEQALSTGDDVISFDDYMGLGKRLGALFFPINL